MQQVGISVMNAIPGKHNLVFSGAALDQINLRGLTIQTPCRAPGLVARLSAALRSLGSLPRRLAVLDELNELSDRELADVGLRRADLRRVFDANFVREREAVRAA